MRRETNTAAGNKFPKRTAHRWSEFAIEETTDTILAHLIKFNIYLDVLYWKGSLGILNLGRWTNLRVKTHKSW